MFFCEKCRYLFNVTKDIKSKQMGGKINESLTNILNKYSKNEKIIERDLKNIKGKDLLNDERVENMTKKEQKRLMSTLKAVDKNFFVEEEIVEPKIGSNIAYFICKYCKNYKQIKPGTLIYSKNYGTNNASETVDYTYMIHDQTLPRTRTYICKNADCETHKDDTNKEAVMTKNELDQLVYVCTVCETNWINVI